MKKLIVLLCTAALILSMFTGCNQEEGGSQIFSGLWESSKQKIWTPWSVFPMIRT